MKSYLRHLIDSTSKISLTFDDGPDLVYTPKILDLLDRYQVKASFFLIGQKLEQSTDLAREIFQRGHLLANHSYTHRYSLCFSKKILEEEVLKTQNAFRTHLGILPRFFRPPRGLMAPWLAETIWKRGMEVVKWTFLARDYRFWHKKQFIVNNVTRKIKSGDIIVFHDGLNLAGHSNREESFRSLQELIPRIKEKGLQLVRLDEGLQKTAYLSV